MSRTRIDVQTDSFPLAEPFIIARGARTTAGVLTVTIQSNRHKGWGECAPYSRYGESAESVTRAIRSLPDEINRELLQELLPAGAARNAVDCALWDLEAKSTGKRVWELAGLNSPEPVTTAFTLSLDSPERMNSSALREADRPLLKIKLGTPDDIPRLEAVRSGAPNAQIIVDANEGWSADVYRELTPHLIRLGVSMVEQPLPAGEDDMLSEIDRPVPVCADESCHDRDSLPELEGKYDMVNIKLDKTGGLTEALALRDAAVAKGYQIMVGCMVGSSLAMAPALLVAQGVGITDLDGPLLLSADRTPPLTFDGSVIYPAVSELWG